MAKAKRQVKQQHKRERKANIPSRPKSAAVLRAEERKKVLPKRDKSEKSLARLLSRSKKLEFQANRLMEDSKKAYAKYQALLEVWFASVGVSSHPVPVANNQL